MQPTRWLLIVRFNTYQMDLAPACFRFHEQLCVQRIAATASTRKNAYAGDVRCMEVVVFTSDHEHRACADAGRFRRGGHRHEQPATIAKSGQPRWRWVRDP